MSFDFVMELKQALKRQPQFQDRYPENNLHFHDGCGGQSFTLDQTGEDLTAYLSDYFDKRNLTAVFSEDRRQFTVTEKKTC
ncbi:MAG: hypothetical protein ACI3YK_03125 [Eubacteriales bacterium]